MNLMMQLALVVWIIGVLLAIIGSGARMVASLARDLHPQLFAAASAGVRQLSVGGALSGVIGVVASATTAVVIADIVHGQLWAVVLSVGVAVLVVLTFQEFAHWFVIRQFNWLAPRVFGDAAVFLGGPPLTSNEQEEARDEPMEQVVEAGEKAGLIESDEHEMISGIIRLDRTLTRDIMIPRIDVIALEVDTPLKQALDVVISSSVSRVPVFEESIDRVIGLLYGKDLLKRLHEGETEFSIRDLLRPVHFVPESKRLDELLQELQKSQVHMAIVVDEYGGMAGIVTIEDVLEQIVGEIQDEYDTSEEPLVERVSESECIFDARATVSQVNEELSADLPTEAGTIAGLIFKHLEKMPKVEDQIVMDGLTIAVLSMVGRRIKRVRVTKKKISRRIAKRERVVP